MKFLYEEMTWAETDAAAAAGAVAVIPFGTTEQHGPHLPLMVDYLCAGSVGKAAVERVCAAQPDQAAPPRAVLLHPVVYSFNEHHMDLPGTIAISADTIIKYMVDIGRSLAHHGFQRIIILNGHGSNMPFTDVSARLITNQTPSICCGLAWWSLLDEQDLAWRESEWPGGFSHACELETSMVLHLRPDLVDMSKAVRTMDEVQRSPHIFWELQRGAPVFFQEWWSRNGVTGVQGDATLATAEKGRIVFEAAVRKLAGFIEEFAAREIRPRQDVHTAKQADGRRRWWLSDAGAPLG
jgi:creatinine amidohydrolase